MTINGCKISTGAAGGMCCVDEGRCRGGALHASGCRARRGEVPEPCCDAGECSVVQFGFFGFVIGWRSAEAEDGIEA